MGVGDCGLALAGRPLRAVPRFGVPSGPLPSEKERADLMHMVCSMWLQEESVFEVIGVRVLIQEDSSLFFW